MFEILILDVDGGVTAQAELLARSGAIVLPLCAQSGRLRFWCRKDEMLSLARQVADACRTGQPKAIFYGSGDYHHLAYVGISLVREPFTIIHFDNHSDYWREAFVNLLAEGRWWRPADTFNYGSWVNAALRLSRVKKVVQFGVDGDFSLQNYLPFPKGMHTHAFDQLLWGRVETYPNYMHSSTLYGTLRGALPCVRFKHGFFTTIAEWKNMSDHGGVRAVVEQALRRVPTEAVYITIDKDVLDENENFSAYPGFSGHMRLQELLGALDAIVEQKRVVGLDVCGDASSYEALADIRTFTKKTMADRQYARYTRQQYSAPANTQRNEAVNLQILEHLNRPG